MESTMLAQIYKVDGWPPKAQHDGMCTRFVVPAEVFEREGFHLAWRDALPGARHAYRSYYIHNADDERRVRVDVVPAPSFEGAKEALLSDFGACAGIVPRSDALELGDIAFGSGAAQWFVRGNLVISLANAGIDEVDVRPFAKALDREAVSRLGA